MVRLVRKTRVAWNHPRHARFLTHSCFKRFPLLNHDRSRRCVVAAPESTRSTHDVALWAYVIMPEHVYNLLNPRTVHYNMARILVALKRPVSDAARAHLEASGATRWLNLLTVTYLTRRVFRFWQPGGGFDRNIFREESVSAITDYIENNPVRRGLVSVPTDWTWSSARFRLGFNDVPIRVNEPAPRIDPATAQVHWHP